VVTMISGIINVDKAPGMTSHDVVAILRRVIGQKRIGHTGTLDPMVTGVLPICLGRATKLSDYISDQGKTYVGVMKFGFTTDTLDITGEILERGGETSFSRQRILDAFSAFTGDILQQPPMYSAVRVNGKRLYELARAGKSVERKARPVTIHALELLEQSGDEIRFRCVCSKGTYIRQLVSDIARSLGTLGVLLALQRTQVGPYDIESAVSIEALKAMDGQEVLRHVRPMDGAIPHMPKLVLDAHRGELAEHGVRLTLNAREAEACDRIDEEQCLRIYRMAHFIGIGHLTSDETGRRLIVDKILSE